MDGAVEVNLRVWVDGVSRDPDQVDPDVRERLREMQRRAFEVQMAEPDAGPEEPFEPPASTRLGDVGCPVLVLVGDLDQPVILEVADQLVEGIPGARKEVITGTAHAPNMEKPEEFNRLVLDFLEATAEPRRWRLGPRRSPRGGVLGRYKQRDVDLAAEPHRAQVLPSSGHGRREVVQACSGDAADAGRAHERVDLGRTHVVATPPIAWIATCGLPVPRRMSATFRTV